LLFSSGTIEQQRSNNHAIKRFAQTTGILLNEKSGGSTTYWLLIMLEATKARAPSLNSNSVV
jgi:hypothetical protein